MTIYEYLKNDHKKIEGLLDRLVNASNEDRDSWKQILVQISEDLIPHARAEEAVFYNAIRELDPGNELVRHSYAEHMKAETALRTLQAMKLIDMNWKSLASKFREDLLHHVSEEEGRLFPAARKLFSDEEATAIGNAFQKLKTVVEDQSALGTTMDLIANLLPPRLVSIFRKGYAERFGKEEKKSA